MAHEALVLWSLVWVCQTTCLHYTTTVSRLTLKPTRCFGFTREVLFSHKAMSWINAHRITITVRTNFIVHDCSLNVSPEYLSSLLAVIWARPKCVRAHVLRAWVRLHVCMYACIHAYVFEWEFECGCTCVCACVCVCMFVRCVFSFIRLPYRSRTIDLRERNADNVIVLSTALSWLKREFPGDDAYCRQLTVSL